MTTLDFDGIAFDPAGARATAPAAGPAVRQDDSAPVAARSDSAAVAPVDHGSPVHPVAADAIAQIRAGIVAAHRSALNAQTALQRELWRQARGGVAGRQAESIEPVRSEALVAAHPSVPGSALVAAAGAQGSAILAATHAAEGSFKALARTQVSRLDAAALRQLAESDASVVFGGSHRRAGVEVAARLASTTPLTLTAVSSIELYGGNGNGRVIASFEGDPRAAALQAAEVFALYTGMPLCLSGSTLTGGVGESEAGFGSGTVDLVVDRLDVVPRPFLQATATLGDGTSVAVTMMVAERHGAEVGPGQAVPRVLLNEFHMAHLARGDQAIAMGQEFAEYTGVRATRLPTGGLLLVDRVTRFDGARGEFESASYDTEYDSPADSWYYGDTANDSMPHFVYMETSLQAALLMGYYVGPTLTQPGTTLSLRNLGGTATVLRQVDLRDKTIQQASRLLSTTILPGSSLQTFDYTLSVDGEPFYRGETMFGYFSDQALGNQTGLDAGRYVPSWLSAHPEATPRVIDVAARRADPVAPACSRRKLALIDSVEVVDEGGNYGAGYLHSVRAIDPADWFFDRHFHLDPVIPGSLGVESVIHAVQEWMLDAGYAAGLQDPVFRIPQDLAFSWRYRGQFLPTDGTVELEAHIKSVHRGPNSTTVVVDGSLWKPGLRIYELIDLAIELADREVLS